MTAKIRDASPDDVPFLAQIALLAARSHVEKGVWDFLVPGSESDRLRCVEAVLLTPQSSWCHYSNFIVAEVDGVAAAALSGYPAQGSPALRSELLPMDKSLVAGLSALGWGEVEIGEAFKRMLFFLGCHSEDESGAWIVEWVAALATYRRQGLVRALLLEMLERGRRSGHALAQIGILMGNAPAQRAYEEVGFELTLEKTTPEFEEQTGSPGLARLLLRYESME
jgi:ribosomal protein S18 acetylase RimI-like enzyme